MKLWKRVIVYAMVQHAVIWYCVLDVVIDVISVRVCIHLKKNLVQMLIGIVRAMNVSYWKMKEMWTMMLQLTKIMKTIMTWNWNCCIYIQYLLCMHSPSTTQIQKTKLLIPLTEGFLKNMNLGSSANNVCRIDSTAWIVNRSRSSVSKKSDTKWNLVGNLGEIYSLLMHGMHMLSWKMLSRWYRHPHLLLLYTFQSTWKKQNKNKVKGLFVESWLC